MHIFEQMYPIRCFTCIKVLGNKWETWYILTQGKCITNAHTVYDKKGKWKIVKINKKARVKEILEHYGLSKPVTQPVACDLMGIERKCCRTVMMSTQVYD